MKKYLILLILLLSFGCSKKDYLLNDYSSNANTPKVTIQTQTKMELIQTNSEFNQRRYYGVITATDFDNDKQQKYLILCPYRYINYNEKKFSKIEFFDIINPATLTIKETERLIKYLKLVKENYNNSTTTYQAEYNEFILKDEANIGTTVRLLFSNNNDNIQFTMNFIAKKKVISLDYEQIQIFIELLEEGLKFLKK